LKIAVNTRLLLKDRLEGIGWFSYEILKRITRNHPEHEFLFIFDRPFAPEFIFGDNVKGVVIGPPARHPILFYIWFELSIPRLLKKHKVDLFLSPEPYMPLKLNVPSIQTIHDLSFEHYPNDLPFAAQKYNQRMIPLAAKKASQIFSVSEYSKSDIAKLYGISADKIDVVYNASKEDFVPSSSEQIQETRNKYSGGKPYYLYVGALNPRKNLVNLFKAYDQVCEAKGAENKLVVVGNKMYWTKEIEQTFNSMKFKNEVVFLGHLDTDNLNKVYGAALALTYISYFEGFGIPIVEAFRSHCPVITSNVTSMPEVAGDAALLVDPFKVDEIAEAMMQIANSDELRQDLIKKGCQQVKKFSWDISAEKIWESLVKITGPSTGSGSLDT
jgi:glycosyltransferase involved in cell wall biosynthesis